MNLVAKSNLAIDIWGHSRERKKCILQMNKLYVAYCNNMFTFK